MVPGSKNIHGLLLASCFLAVMMGPVAPAIGGEKVLYAFKGGTDGSIPSGSLIVDKAGDLYGTTVEGGSGTNCRNSTGCGTVFEIAPDGVETVIHAFAGGCDGANPVAGLVADKTGNLYGTTRGGGICSSDVGFGTVFELAPDGTESVLYAFQGGNDGEYPAGDLAGDGKGNLFGTTDGGGGTGCSGTGCGTAFKVAPDGSETILHAFLGGSDGAGPLGDVIVDKADTLYGTTLEGGGTGCGGTGCGTVFKVAADGTETILYAFQGGTDGKIPESGVLADSAGNLYGTTTAGGTGLGDGTVYKLSPDGVESVLHSFQGGTDGSAPYAGVILDKTGNLYGTTYDGGGTWCKGGGCGTVFEIVPSGKETVLFAFRGRHGANPAASLLLKSNRLYGTATAGGQFDNGVVFKLKE